MPCFWRFPKRVYIQPISALSYFLLFLSHPFPLSRFPSVSPLTSFPDSPVFSSPSGSLISNLLLPEFVLFLSPPPLRSSVSLSFLLYLFLPVFCWITHQLLPHFLLLRLSFISSFPVPSSTYSFSYFPFLSVLSSTLLWYNPLRSFVLYFPFPSSFLTSSASSRYSLFSYPFPFIFFSLSYSLFPFPLYLPLAVPSILYFNSAPPSFPYFPLYPRFFHVTLPLPSSPTCWQGINTCPG